MTTPEEIKKEIKAEMSHFALAVVVGTTIGVTWNDSPEIAIGVFATCVFFALFQIWRYVQFIKKI